MYPYLPHTQEEIAAMLADIGVKSIDDLFADIPEAVRFSGELNLGDGLAEYEVYTRLLELARGNKTDYVSYLGCGSYDHIIPSVVHHITGRSEFYTAYTPYQAEMSQGVLQAIFEFQTLICQLTSLDVSNASLYDGHTAASEAATIALNSVKRSNTILYSQTLHPHTKQILKTHFAHLDVKLVEVKQENGVTSLQDLKAKLTGEVAGLIVQTPNFMGVLEDFSGFADLLHNHNALFIVSSNPISLGVLKSQGEWGADVAIGDAQPFGIPSAFGGPSVGYIAVREKLMRKIPGRLVGQTLDREGKRAFVLTLQAREQHIKREKATSNICSNQALMSLATTVHLSLLGKQGLLDVGRENVNKAHYLYAQLAEKLNLSLLYEQPFFNEFTIRLGKNAEQVTAFMEQRGIFPGIPLNRFVPGAADDALIVAVTEKRTKKELDSYVENLKGIVE